MIRVVLAEDHHLIRSALVTFLTQQADIEVVGEVGDGSLIIPTIEKLQPDILLLDAHMPNHKVLVTANQLRSSFPDVRILVLSAYKQREFVVGLLQAGAAGYILKDDPKDSLVQGIHAVLNGSRWLSARVMDVLVQSATETQSNAVDQLSEREIAILNLVANGSRNAQIAEELHLTEQTIKNYLRRIFEKLGVDSRVAAVVLAIKLGIVQIDS